MRPGMRVRRGEEVGDKGESPNAQSQWHRHFQGKLHPHGMPLRE